MNKSKLSNLIEYVPAALILTYFFIHNIGIVFIGIIFSLYLININFINNFSRSINNSINRIKTDKELDKDYKNIKSNNNEINLNNNDSRFTLVETIEELGFIPSIDKNDDKNAA